MASIRSGNLRPIHRFLPLLGALCLGAGCKASPSEGGGHPVRKLRAVLVQDGQGGLAQWPVISVTKGQVYVQQGDKPKPYPLAQTLDVDALRKGPRPRVGDVAAGRRGLSHWAPGLVLGVDAKAVTLYTRLGLQRFGQKAVIRLPPKHAVVTRLRPVLTLQRDALLLVPDRPPGWAPKAADPVLIDAWNHTVRTNVVQEARGPVFLLGQHGGRQDWVSLLQLAPPLSAHAPRARVGDRVLRQQTPALGRVIAVDEHGIRGWFGLAGKQRVAHGRYVVLRPRASVSLPPFDPAAADCITRTLIARDLLLELGAVHTARAGAPRTPTLRMVAADGSSVATARVERSQRFPKGQRPGLKVVNEAMKSCDGSKGLYVARLERDLYTVRRFRLGSPLPAGRKRQLASTSRALLTWLLTK